MGDSERTGLAPAAIRPSFRGHLAIMRTDHWVKNVFVLPGTVVAAISLGLVENLTTVFIGPSWSPAVAFGALLATLAWRPSGLFGRS